MQDKEIKKEKKELLEVLEKGERDFQEGRCSPMEETKERVDLKLKERFEKERRK